jgi:hypothetical protein
MLGLTIKFRPFAKGWLEIILNMFVVGLFNYVADKSQYSALKLFAFFTTLLFSVYSLSYVQEALPVRSQAKNKYVRVVMQVIIVAFSLFVLWSWSNIIYKVIDELSKVQVR